MDNAQLIFIGESLGRVAGAFAEAKRQWHPAHGGTDVFPHRDECLEQEARVLRDVGQKALAKALSDMIKGEAK